ncbi:hypothetical+protein [Methylocapsa aurea]|uniref:hypothetical protein n=1 Tax=Methylocapsa aurea TaxID=663610 RepID=UPI003D18CE29
MQKFIRIAAVVLLSGASVLPALAQSPPKPAEIDRNGILILVRTTLIALDQANKTGLYTVLRDIGSPQFQVNSAARLSEIFATHRRDGLDLSPVVVMEPTLTAPPQIDANGMLHIVGFFPSVQKQVNFDLSFAPDKGYWSLFGISINLGSSVPKAPEPPQAANRQPPPRPIIGKK